ncbi:MAG: diacylglycerol/lipid kinase family protein [Chitinophagales bacterium]
MNSMVIANPIAGRHRVQAELPRLRELCARHFPGNPLLLTEGPGHAEQLAREAAAAGYDRVVAVGGDGTVGEVLNGLAYSRTALAIVPYGTGNDLARELGLPWGLDEALACAATGARRRIDLGEEGGRYFGVIVGVGFAAEVMRQTNRRSGPVKGPAAILLAILQTLAELRPLPVTLVLDEGTPEERRTQTLLTALFVMNTRTTGGGLKLCPEAAPDDGLLDLCLMKDIGRLDLVATLPKAYKGRHVGHPKVEFYRARTVRLEASKPLTKMFDGDLFGDAPLEARLCPGALEVVVPQESAVASR